jgi:TPR repeat protein
LPPNLLPQAPIAQSEARRHLERAAYLGFAPAQYKLGHAYEFASPPFPFDALLSVQYYSLASQQGEVEADMALSKWFLCGAEGAFDKDEGLAFTFAEKAARRGLPSAEFAMGYYKEVGVGGEKDIQEAMRWYTLVCSFAFRTGVSFLMMRRPRNTEIQTLSNVLQRSIK